MMISPIFLPSLVRGIDLLGMVLLVGGLIFNKLVLYQPGKRSRAIERLLPFLLLAAGLADLVERSKMISGQSLEEVWPFLPTVLFQTHFGKVWIARTCSLCFLCGISIIKIPDRVREGAALGAGVLLLLTASLSGHAADSGDFSLAVLTDWLHLLAVSAWTGGLFFLAFLLKNWILSPRPEAILTSLVTPLRRFSTLAGICVVVILTTGSYQVWHRVWTFAALFQTPYGQALIVKLTLVLVLLGLGAFNRYRMLPRFARQTADPSAAPATGVPRRLLQIVAAEIALGLAIVACAALLTQLPPARNQLGTGYKIFSHAHNHSGHGNAHLSGLQPAEGASVKILSPKSTQAFKGDEIPIHFQMVKGKRGNHVHAYVDGELMGMFSSEKGTLTGIKAGHHTLELRVVAEDHQTELDATDRVEFVIK